MTNKFVQNSLENPSNVTLSATDVVRYFIDKHTPFKPNQKIAFTTALTALFGMSIATMVYAKAGFEGGTHLTPNNAWFPIITSVSSALINSMVYTISVKNAPVMYLELGDTLQKKLRLLAQLIYVRNIAQRNKIKAALFSRLSATQNTLLLIKNLIVSGIYYLLISCALVCASFIAEGENQPLYSFAIGIEMCLLLNGAVNQCSSFINKLFGMCKTPVISEQEEKIKLLLQLDDTQLFEIIYSTMSHLNGSKIDANQFIDKLLNSSISKISSETTQSSFTHGALWFISGVFSGCLTLALNPGMYAFNKAFDYSSNFKKIIFIVSYWVKIGSQAQRDNQKPAGQLEIIPTTVFFFLVLFATEGILNNTVKAWKKFKFKNLKCNLSLLLRGCQFILSVLASSSLYDFIENAKYSAQDQTDYWLHNKPMLLTLVAWPALFTGFLFNVAQSNHCINAFLGLLSATKTSLINKKLETLNHSDTNRSGAAAPTASKPCKLTHQDLKTILTANVRETLKDRVNSLSLNTDINGVASRASSATASPADLDTHAPLSETQSLLPQQKPFDYVPLRLALNEAQLHLQTISDQHIQQPDL